MVEGKCEAAVSADKTVQHISGSGVESADKCNKLEEVTA